ncbi:MULTISPECIES: phage major capsid protein [unclassified Phyllobacterium]|uniref:phage major capsid protein n=1 Tax=unclassified Phyllobacterium TaxID=2638441 RepID=UPI003012A60B
MNRAYSIMTVKAVDEYRRIIRGTATTPSPDRVGDIVDPLGVAFKNPMPLLWQHKNDKPVGLVKFDKPTKDGITFEAELPKIEEAGALKDRVDEAWQSVKAGLVAAVSIGFRAIEYAFLDDGGIRFMKSEVYELSLVTIPANADATISLIKSIDAPVLAATGNEPKDSDRPVPPGVTGKTTHKTVKLVKPEGRKPMAKSLAEQISAFEATRVAKAARMEEIMDAAAESGETLDAEQEQEYDTLASEVKSVDNHLKRLRDMETVKAVSAKPVNGVKTTDDGSNVRAGTVKAPRQLEKGIEFAQFAICLGAAKGNLMQAEQIAKSRFGDNEALNVSLKAAVNAGTTTDATWAAPLVDTYQRFAGDFVEFLRPQTVIGRFGSNGVPSLRRVPFNISIVGQTSGGAGYWVGEGKPKPLTKFDFNEVTLRWAKVANIAVITEELLRFSNPSAEALVRDQLAAALIAKLDVDFLDPAKAAVANVSPASITNGVTPIVSSGNDADAIRADVQALFAAYIAANMTPASGVWIMSATTALALSMLTNPLGQPEFPGVTMNGGTFWGMPVIVTEYTPDGFVILANASDIFLADDGQVVIDASREASLQMDDAPTNASNPATATSVVSMFQTNSVAIRAERWINWQKRRPQAVQVLSGVAWGQPTTP